VQLHWSKHAHVAICCAFALIVLYADRRALYLSSVTAHRIHATSAVSSLKCTHIRANARPSGALCHSGELHLLCLKTECEGELVHWKFAI
jgi:hypothetical protein